MYVGEHQNAVTYYNNNDGIIDHKFHGTLLTASNLGPHAEQNLQ